MSKKTQIKIQVEDVLERLIPFLKNQAAVRLATHVQAIEDIHQQLADQGIDELQEQSFLRFMGQCRSFLQEEIDRAWKAIQEGLSNPHPFVRSETSATIYTALDNTVSSVETTLSYFDKFEERLGRPQVRELVNRLKSQVSEERTLSMQVKQLDIEKFIEIMKRTEAQRLHALPTFFDEIVRWFKNRPMIAWSTLIISGIVFLNGLPVVLHSLKDFICNEKPALECVSSTLGISSTFYFGSSPNESIRSENLGAVEKKE